MAQLKQLTVLQILLQINAPAYGFSAEDPYIDLSPLQKKKRKCPAH